MKKQDKQLIEQVTDMPNFYKYLKIGGVIVGSVIGIYILGHVFKISAHCVRGYNELQTALKNG